MDTNKILAELRAERGRLDQAISALEAVSPAGGRRVGRPPGKSRKRGGMGAAARKKLSRLLKQRWAQGKMKRGKASKPPRRMSRAARKKIAAAQRARWARQKAQQKSAV
jgi:hypothetical protein